MPPKVKRQTQIPGTEGKTFKDVDEAAEHYVDVRDKRMKLTESEVDAKEQLIAKMKERKLSLYRDEGADLIVEYTAKDKVKVRRAKDENADD